MQKVPSAPAAEEPARPLFRLKLDHDDVYFGCETIAATSEVSESDVVLDHAPDNAPGCYRWLRDLKRLEPLPKAQQKTEPGAPTLEQALCELLIALIQTEALRTPLPPRLGAWLAWFEKTIDAKPSKRSES